MVDSTLIQSRQGNDVSKSLLPLNLDIRYHRIHGSDTPVLSLDSNARRCPQSFFFLSRLNIPQKNCSYKALLTVAEVDIVMPDVSEDQSMKIYSTLNLKLIQLEGSGYDYSHDISEASKKHATPPPAYTTTDPVLVLQTSEQQRNRTGWPVGNRTVDWPYTQTHDKSVYWAWDDQGIRQPTKATLEVLRTRQALAQYDANLKSLAIWRQKSWFRRFKTKMQILLEDSCNIAFDYSQCRSIWRAISPFILTGAPCYLHSGLKCFCVGPWRHGRKQELRTMDFKIVVFAELDKAAHNNLKCNVHNTESCYCCTIGSRGCP